MKNKGYAHFYFLDSSHKIATIGPVHHHCFISKYEYEKYPYLCWIIISYNEMYYITKINK